MEDQVSQFDVALEQEGVPFKFNEDVPEDLRAELQRQLANQMRARVLEIINRLATILFNSRDTHKELVLLCYLCGLDMTTLIGARANTIEEVARTMKMRKQTFHEMLERCARNNNIPYLPRNWGGRKTKLEPVKRKRKVV